MRISIFRVLLILCLVPTFPAFAEVGSHWQPIIDQLLHYGITKIGNFNVEEFRNAPHPVHPLSEAPSSLLSGSRQSAYYLCPKNDAYVAEDLPTEAITSLAQLELHEILGAGCYKDQTYAISTALTTLAAMNDSAKRQALAEVFAKTIFAGPIKYAGATGVGGGGDLITLFIKNRVLQAIMGDGQNRLSATNEFLVQYALTDFEPLQSSAPRVVYIRYHYFKGGRETFGVLIPMERWRQGAAARQALIQETKLKIMEIFPSYSNQAVRTFRPGDCGSAGPVITFPETNDVSVRAIQDARGGILLGCRKFDKGFTDIQIEAPSLKDSDEPKDAGYFYFSCGIKFGQNPPLKSRVQIFAGQSTTKSYSWSTAAGGDLAAAVSISKSGGIEYTEMKYRINGQRTPIREAKASVSMPIEGEIATFSCQKEDR